MLLIGDRNFFGFRLVNSVRERGAHLRVRVKANQLVFPRLETLADGSYLSKIYPNYHDKKADRNGRLVRVIESTHDDPGRPGCGEKCRLVTDVLDPDELPARDAVLLYHERWEHELALDEIKTHLKGRETPLRSNTPRGVIQEFYGRLLAHRLIRQTIVDAAARRRLDPDRLSFIDAVRLTQCHLHESIDHEPAAWYERLVRENGWRELRPRRLRGYPREVKRKRKPYSRNRPGKPPPPQPTKPFAHAIPII